MRLRRLLLCACAGVLAVGSLAAPSGAQTSSTDKQRQLGQQILEAGTAEQAALDTLQQIRDRKAPIDARVAELDSQLASVQAKLGPLEAESARLQTLLDDALAKLAAQQAQYDAAKLEFDGEAAQLYRSARHGATYDYVRASRPSDLVQGAKYLDQVNQHQREVVRRISQIRDDMDAQRKSIADQKQQADTNTAQVQQLHDQIASMRAEVEPARAQAATEAANEEQQLTTIKSQKTEYEKELAELQAASDSIAAQLRVNPTPGVVGSCLFRPVAGQIVSPFGSRVDPISGAASTHPGVDMAASMGTPIHACRAGTVVIASWQGGYGNAVVIDHGGGMATLYGHQSQLGVSVGDRVLAGQIIGYVGSTGYSTGPHLHFEVRLAGNPVNPVPYL